MVLDGRRDAWGGAWTIEWFFCKSLIYALFGGFFTSQAEIVVCI